MDIKILWDKYHLPEVKRNHSLLVARVAVFLAKKLIEKGYVINLDLLEKSALLHDIDKAIPKRSGERHPDTGVRILREEGMGEVANIVATHSLHFILDPQKAPKSWEEKLLFLSDKMVKHSIIGVDERFALWYKEDLPHQVKEELDGAYPKVKELEKEILTKSEVDYDEIH